MTDGDSTVAAGVPEEIAAAARHGSWCPKMCSHACPVTSATGRDDAVPWSFHRTVDDLAEGRLDAAGAAGRLAACSGCLGCRVPCLFEQDVPAQVRAGRAAAAAEGHPVDGTTAAVEAVEAGRSPYGLARASTTGGLRGGLALVVGCRDEQAVVDAAVKLLEAAGLEVTPVVPRGCCGATLRDLGATGAAEAASRALAGTLAGADATAAIDPHCLPELEGGDLPGPARHVLEVLAEAAEAGELPLDGPGDVVTYHDPCLLARRDGVVEPPRALLRHAGLEVEEPEGHGVDTVCAGAGLALELVDADAAAATAARRRDQLAATDGHVVTACGGARRLLRTVGGDVADVLVVLADRLAEPS